MSLSSAAKRRWPKTLLVTLACLSGATTSGYFLYLDYFAVGADGTGQRMAVVEQQVASVKRRPSKSFLWSRTLTGQSVFRRDSILVGPESSAALKLDRGTSLEIGENSLIVLDDLSNLSVNYMRGAFVLRSAAGDKWLTIDKSGKIREEDMEMRLVTPAPQARLYTLPSRGGQVPFRWKKLRGKKTSGDYRLQISDDRSFPLRSTQTLSISPTELERNVSLQPGNYYWRMVSENKVVTETRRLRVSKPQTMKPIWPASGSTVEQWGDGGEVEFRWVAPQVQADSDTDISKHWIEISEDNSFKTPLLREPVIAQNGVASVPKLPQGAVFFRFVSQYGEIAVATPAQQIQVRRTETLPVLPVSPRANETMAVPKQIRLRWDIDRNDAEFLLEIERLENGGTKPLLTQTLKARSFAWKSPPSGTFRWRVSAIQRGQTMGVSEWQRVHLVDGEPLAVKGPTPAQKVYFWDKPDPVAFSWVAPPSLPEGQQFRLEVARDHQFKLAIAKKETREGNVSLNEVALTPGVYFWRVSLVDQLGRVLRVSEPVSFTYAEHPPLAPPPSARPSTNVTLSVQNELDPLLEWDTVPAATAYELSIRNVQTKTALTEVRKENSFALKGFSAGKYIWSVRAVDKMGRRGVEMPWRAFTLHFGPLPPPKSVISEVK